MAVKVTTPQSGSSPVLSLAHFQGNMFHLSQSSALYAKLGPKFAVKSKRTFRNNLSVTTHIAQHFC